MDAFIGFMEKIEGVLSSQIRSTMKSRNHQWEEMIFESRNKSFGAYELRVNYEKRLGQAMLWVLMGMVATFVTARILMAKEAPPQKQHYNGLVTIYETPIIQTLNPPKQPKAAPLVPKPPRSVPDPNVFKLVKSPVPIEPVKPIEPPVAPIEPIAPTGGSGGSGVFEKPATAGGGMSGALPTVLSAAIVDKAPEFPGGIEKFYEYLKNNLKYPLEAKEMGISGRLYVSFVVDESGKITSIAFMNKAGFGMEKAVENVLKASPAWSPGVFKNEHVQTSMVIPVSFNLLK